MMVVRNSFQNSAAAPITITSKTTAIASKKYLTRILSFPCGFLTVLFIEYLLKVSDFFAYFFIFIIMDIVRAV